MKVSIKSICPVCDGNGYLIDENICRKCRGTGVVVKKERDEPEILKHSPTVDEWILEQQRKRKIK
jgi:DnaJ-class molecular chaperone